MNALKRLEVIHWNLKQSTSFRRWILVTNFGNNGELNDNQARFSNSKEPQNTWSIY